eukprot:TRINITY_DN6926_c0_g1_i1.p1 TRINITY_DN6926_c0_g1~~TRINITY_DN6926_c0_g1_i1.p1  ORF type:complete len:144 (-),score=46.25 TRINITY_DN6926_c0_g1_i1:86-457(-)
MRARLVIGSQPLTTDYISRVTLDPVNKRTIKAELDPESQKNSVLEFLRNEWKFEALTSKGGVERCQVDFHVNFQLKDGNTIHKILLAQLFNTELFKKMFEAFVQRVEHVQKVKKARSPSPSFS